MLTPLIVVSIICIIIIAPCASSNLTVFDDRRYDRPTPAWLLKPFDNDTRRLFEYMTMGDGVGEAYEWLAELVDTFGHRMVGSRALEDAIDYLVDKLKRDGFDNVHTEAVDELPNWVRGEEDRVELIEPRRQRLNVLAVGGSTSANITAEAIVVDSIDELKSLDVNLIRGKIVILVEKWQGYGETVSARKSAYIAERYGAVALLLKSVAPFSLDTPHTGSGSRDATIPSGCMTIEEAEMLQRMYRRGKKLVIHLRFTSSNQLDTVTSRNTIFELTGSEKPNEIVLISAHLDSWDVGQGALDDGGGCAIMWHALYTLKKLGFRPLRTIRVIFWTAEEQGLLGAAHYYNSHRIGNDSATTNETFYFVAESDLGAFRPRNWLSTIAFAGNAHQLARLDDILLLINRFGIPLAIRENSDQGDVVFWARDGVPSVNYVADRGFDYYFYFHHTNADYLNVFEKNDLEYCAFIFATLVHVIANVDDCF